MWRWMGILGSIVFWIGTLDGGVPKEVSFIGMKWFKNDIGGLKNHFFLKKVVFLSVPHDQVG